MVRPPEGMQVNFVSSSAALPRGHIVQIPNRPPYTGVPIDGQSGGMTDLHLMVKRVPFPCEPAPSAQFSPGQKRPAQSCADQSAAPFLMGQDGMPTKVMRRTDLSPASLSSQPATFVDTTELGKTTLSVEGNSS